MDKQKIIYSYFQNRTAVLATMHKKESVISPILKEKLGISIIVPNQFYTDRFGTFTRDVVRKGSQLEAARAKLKAAMKQTDATIGIASEGIFGPHPLIPFIPYNQELVVFYDQDNDLEIV